MALECKVKSFDNGILVGEIVNVCADESVLTDGKIDPKKLKPIAFDPPISPWATKSATHSVPEKP